jgi:hypothetical protein
VNCSIVNIRQKRQQTSRTKHIHAPIKMLFTDAYNIVCIYAKKISGINFVLSETPAIMIIYSECFGGVIIGKRA